MLQLTKLKGVEDLKRLLTSVMEIQSLEFAQLVLGFALVQYFISVLPSLTFGIVMYIMCHCMLEVCDLLLLL